MDERRLIMESQVRYPVVLEGRGKRAPDAGPEVIVARADAGARGVDAGQHDGVYRDQVPQPELSVEVHPRAHADLQGLGPELECPVVQVFEPLVQLELVAMPLGAPNIFPRQPPYSDQLGQAAVAWREQYPRAEGVERLAQGVD